MIDTAPSTDETAEAVVDVPVEPAAPGRRIRQRVGRLSRAGIVTAVLIVLVVLAAGWAGWQWKQAEDLESAREQALEAARRDAVVVASYDYHDLDSYFEDVRALATGDFADQYAEANENLRKVLVKTKAEVEATVVDAGVRSASDNKVVVLLFVDQTVKNAATRGEATDRVRMTMTLIRVDDEWLVSELELP